MKKILSFIIPVILLFAACYNPGRYGAANLSSHYSEQAKYANFTNFAWHVNDSVSRLFFSINTEGLLYLREQPAGALISRFDIFVNLFSGDDIRKAGDTLRFEYADSLLYNTGKQLTDSMDLKIQTGSIINAAITFHDRNRKSKFVQFLQFDKTDPGSRQYFILRDTLGRPEFNPYKTPGEKMFFQNNYLNSGRLSVRYYKHDFQAAAPPFVENRTKPFSFRADSIFHIEITDGFTGMIRFSKQGTYHFQTDTSKHSGFTVFIFHDAFPKIISSDNMLKPLRYISSRNEYNQMGMMKNTKEAVDGFWLERAGSIERARELIRRYYNRVQDANLFFSSYTEGWKTDRGMIYIVYGPPNVVYRTTQNETWIYGEDRNFLSINFVFTKVTNPFTDNDYSLDRSAEYKDTWYSAVENWRK